MNLFSFALLECGLAGRDAADFLGAQVYHLSAWIKGQTPPPRSAFMRLIALAEQQEAAAMTALKDWEEAGAPNQIEIELSTTDDEARALGWPCAAAHSASVNRFMKSLPRRTRIHMRSPSPGAADASMTIRARSASF